MKAIDAEAAESRITRSADTVRVIRELRDSRSRAVREPRARYGARTRKKRP